MQSILHMIRTPTCFTHNIRIYAFYAFYALASLRILHICYIIYVIYANVKYLRKGEFQLRSLRYIYADLRVGA